MGIAGMVILLLSLLAVLKDLLTLEVGTQPLRPSLSVLCHKLLRILVS